MLIEESERRQNVLEQYLREMASSSMDDEKVLDMAVKLEICISVDSDIIIPDFSR